MCSFHSSSAARIRGAGLFLCFDRICICIGLSAVPEASGVVRKRELIPEDEKSESRDGRIVRVRMKQPIRNRILKSLMQSRTLRLTGCGMVSVLEVPGSSNIAGLTILAFRSSSNCLLARSIVSLTASSSDSTASRAGDPRSASQPSISKIEVVLAGELG